MIDVPRSFLAAFVSLVISASALANFPGHRMVQSCLRTLLERSVPQEGDIFSYLASTRSLEPNQGVVLETRTAGRFFWIYRSVAYSFRRSYAVSAQEGEVSWVVRRLGIVDRISNTMRDTHRRISEVRNNGKTGIATYAGIFDPLSLWTPFAEKALRAFVVTGLPTGQPFTEVVAAQIPLPLNDGEYGVVSGVQWERPEGGRGAIAGDVDSGQVLFLPFEPIYPTALAVAGSFWLLSQRAGQPIQNAADVLLAVSPVISLVGIPSLALFWNRRNERAAALYYDMGAAHYDRENAMRWFPYASSADLRARIDRDRARGQGSQRR